MQTDWDIKAREDQRQEQRQAIHDGITTVIWIVGLVGAGLFTAWMIGVL